MLIRNLLDRRLDCVGMLAQTLLQCGLQTLFCLLLRLFAALCKAFLFCRSADLIGVGLRRRQQLCDLRTAVGQFLMCLLGQIFKIEAR